MEDILLEKKCEKCGSNITLMASCRMSKDKNEGEYLVERCLSCGQHPITEVAKLDDDQSDLETFGGPIVNLKWKDKK